MRTLCIVVSLVVLLALPAFAGDYDPTQEIRDIQAKIEAQGLRWTAGHTAMMNIPPAERNQYLGLKIPEDAKQHFEELNQQPAPLLLSTQHYFNWQEFNCVSPVGDQRSCGSCWDFAATHAFESAYIMATGTVRDFAEQQGLVCNWGGSDCDGGWMRDAYLVYMNYGVVDEECMPYYANDSYPCIEDQCEPIALLDGYEDVPNNVNAIKNALLLGPLSTTFTVYDDFYGYQSGCYEHADDEPLNHAVVIVGWDDDMCDGEGAWIVKNSWGLSFGMDGFFYMKYGSAGFGQFTQRPIYGQVQPPQSTMTPESLSVMFEYEPVTANLEITNEGNGPLRYKLTPKQPEGQDEFGYYWRDSDMPDGPTYNWFDITGIGSEIQFNYSQDDDNSGWLDLGFDFHYYDRTYHRVKACTNGWVTFMDGWFNTADNVSFPSTDMPNSLLGVFWDDLNLAYSGSVSFYTNSVDTAVISWNNVADSRNEGRYTFQVILVAPNTIIYQYNQMGPARLDECSIGMENREATMGLEVARNEEYIHNQMAVEFYLGDSNSLDWLTLEMPQGIIEPHTTGYVPITFDGSGHSDGTYSAILTLLTNDINMLDTDIPVTMDKTTLAVDDNHDLLPADFALQPAYPNPFNAHTQINYVIPEPMTVTLKAYNLMGQEVAELYNGYNTAGEHSLTWDASRLASGMYFVKLSGNDMVRTARVVLLK